MPYRTVFCCPQVLCLLFCLLLPPFMAKAQQVKKINEQEMASLLQNQSDTLHIVNFWATWCKPCVKELPYFQQISTENKGSNVKVILISVDFPQDTDSRLIPFLKRRPLPEPVLQMDAKNDEWINTVNPDWSGAIPATFIYNKQRNIYFFAERELSLEELQKYVSLNKTNKP